MKFYQSDFYGTKICAAFKSDIAKISDSLNFIFKKDKQAWSDVKKIKAIIVNSKRGYNNELFRPECVWVCEIKTVRESTVAYLASLVVHEARHVKQYLRGVKNVDFRAEPAAYKDQIKFLEKYGEKYNANYVKKLYAEKYWQDNEFLTKNGKKIVSTPALVKFLERYKNGKLNIKDI